VTQPDERPVVANYCATFLKPEMLHIYRQITSLRRVRPVVIAQKRENAERFPFEHLHVVGKPATHFLRRFWYRQLRDAPWQISRREVDALLSILHKDDSRLLHIYFGHIGVHLLPLIRQWDRPSIVSFHGADVTVDLDKPAYRAATLEMLNAVRLVLVRSDSLGNALTRIGCSAEKVRVQRTGIPVDEIAFREREWPSDGSWHLLQAGRLIEKKGVGTTLRAFARFKQQFPHAKLTVAGEGPLHPELESLAHELEVSDSVTFTGFLGQTQLREQFYSAHLFVHPSETGGDGNQEGVPNAMLEAMATGLPVFATNHGGIPEAIESGINGVLVEERDDEVLARALINAVREPNKLGQLARAARRTVELKFGREDQTNLLEELYWEAIRNPER
jgi:colanic acid/amylovoran biosynthesis glycosyltransferase